MLARPAASAQHSDTNGNAARRFPAPDSPDVLLATAEVVGTAEFQRTVDILTDSAQSIRGCKVNPDRIHLQALQNLLGWTIGGFDTRPTEDARKLKETDRLLVLLTYRQPEDPGDPPRVRMYDYLCDTIFHIPMRPVGSDVCGRHYVEAQGKVHESAWVEADWELLRSRDLPRPGPAFLANRYPYQLPRLDVPSGADELQQCGQHWILWYLHFPGEALHDPGDDVIDIDVRHGLAAVIASAGHTRVDYMWYRNPGMSVPDMFHVQVFWKVPLSNG